MLGLNLELKDWLAIYAAGLSTILAVIKGWELWRDRFRLDVGYCFAGDESIGNTITIRNLSGKPVILVHWDLLYCKGVWPLATYETIESADFDGGDTQIAPHSSLTLSFSDANYFAWGHKALKGRRIFIRLLIAGRSQQLRLVYSGA